jgi:general secretion pathway protein A
MSVYNRFFGFREDPFSITPDSSFFYPSAHHRAALDALVYAVLDRKGFVVLTGPVGSGKTTIVRTMLKSMDPHTRTAVITNTHLSPKGVLVMLMEDLEIAYKPGPKERLILQLNQYLIRQAMEGSNVVLVVDEAQNLSNQCLEELRMLSNLETEKEKLLQILLIGQPELERKLALPQLEQLRQRITIWSRLEPLSREDCRRYIVHRLDRAKSNGLDASRVFDDEAHELVYRRTYGIPRKINVLCSQALLTGFVRESAHITGAMVEEAACEIGGVKISVTAEPVQEGV